MDTAVNRLEVVVSGSGSYLPGEPVPPERIEERLGPITCAPEGVMKWMKRNAPLLRGILGMKNYYYAIDPGTGEYTDDNVTMSVKAAEKALAMAGADASEVDFIAYASPHMDQMPTASVMIQEALGIERCAEISIHANCSSAYKALMVAHNFLATGLYRTALVLSSNVASSELRASYYNQSLLVKEALFLRWFLCDGSAALLLRSGGEARGPLRLRHTHIESVGGRRKAKMFNRRPAYWMNPKEEYELGLHHLCQEFRSQLGGKEFLDGKRSVFAAGLARMLDSCGVDPSRVRLLQVNLPAMHILESVKDECASMGIRPEAFYSRLEDMGYCGPPMAFMSLDSIIREEKLDPGDLVASFALEVSKFMLGGYVAEAR